MMLENENNVNMENVANEELELAGTAEQLPEVELSAMNKPALLAALEELIAKGELLSIAGQVRAIREKYIELAKEDQTRALSAFIEQGGLKEEFYPPKDETDEAFNKAIKTFYDKRNELIEKREKDLKNNVVKKKQLIEELKELIDSMEPLSKRYQLYQSIQTRWREAGPVPSADNNDLWLTYRLYTDKFFELIKLNNELRELNHKRNLELKTELCEKAERLIDEPSITKALAELRGLQDQWKETGFVAKEQNEEIWNRFKAAADKLFEKRKSFVLEQDEKQKQNLIAKQALVAQLETLQGGEYKTHSEWQKAKTALDQLWNEWQKIGYVPKEEGDATWNRFKELRQQFYQNKDQYYTTIKSSHNANLEKKVALCEKAEALKDSTDWVSSTKALIQLQEDWKKVGPVPFAQMDALWKRFRGACDTFFTNKQEHYSVIEKEQKENLGTKEAFIEKISAMPLDNDLQKNIAALRKLQDEWRELGKVPMSDFERINKRYREAVDKKYEEIKLNSGAEEMALLEMKYQQLSETKEGKDELSKERNRKVEIIKKISEEIKLIENNKAMFAKSKNADMFLREFDNKIKDLRFQIKKIEEEIKRIPSMQ